MIRKLIGIDGHDVREANSVAASGSSIEKTPLSSRTVSPPKCSVETGAAALLLKASIFARETSEQVSTRHRPDGQVTQRTTGLERLTPAESWTRLCFLGAAGFLGLTYDFVKKSSFSKSSPQAWRGLGHETRRWSPLQRGDLVATMASQTRLRRLPAGKPA